MDWKPIKTAPLETLILLANKPTAVVEPGHGSWAETRGGQRFIEWTSASPLGLGRFRATHWAPMPAFDLAAT